MDFGLLKSLNQAKVNDIPLTSTEITLGRSPKSTVILSDIRCSGLHCSVTAQAPSEFLIKDHSSNGTFLNGVLIGKGNWKIAKLNDKLELLPALKGIEPGSEISFLFTDPNKRKNLGSMPGKMKVINGGTVEDQATCTICFEIMADPVSLYPCLHVFCEECYLDWRNRSSDCPYCREPVREHKKCKFMNDIIGIIAEKHPEKLKVAEKCEQCVKKVNRFRCSPGQKHEKCCKCQVLMPRREDQAQNCEICKAFYCNLYFNHCPTGLTALKHLLSKELLVPLGSLNNIYEENLLSDSIRIQRLTGFQVIEKIKKESYLRFTEDSVFCESCFPEAQKEIFDKFLEVLNGNKPNLKKCSKGRRCILQSSIVHSQIYSHY